MPSVRALQKHQGSCLWLVSLWLLRIIYDPAPQSLGQTKLESNPFIMSGNASPPSPRSTLFQLTFPLDTSQARLCGVSLAFFGYTQLF